MKLEPILSDDPHAVLRALRSALNGSGPALALGGVGKPPGTSFERSGRRLEPAAGTAVVITTSGSTGFPKSVVLGRSALTASALATAERIGDGAWLLALPASYIAGLQVLVRALVQGREPAVLAGRFSPQSFAAASLMMVSTHNGVRIPTFTSLVPAQLTTLLDAAVDDLTVGTALRSFEAILIGGQALPPALLERAHDAGARVVRTYGATETCGGCVYDGLPLGGVGVRVRDGELQVSGPMLADGYLGAAELTDAVFPVDRDGVRWYRTGDAGIVADGRVRVRGRLDNVIVSGGVNISLDRIEQVVRGIPGLESAVVVGAPHERWGEVPVIVVARGEALRRSESVQLEGARAAVGAEVGSPARPARLILVDELAVLPSGKPDREGIAREVAHLR